MAEGQPARWRLATNGAQSRTLRLIQESLKEPERPGLRPYMEGVLWHQGENDMLDRRLNVHYAEGLTRLIARMRADLHAPDLKRW